MYKFFQFPYFLFLLFFLYDFIICIEFKHISSRGTPPRPQFAPNDPSYHACRCSKSRVRMPCVPLQWVTRPHTMRAIAVSQRVRIPCVPLQWVSAPACHACRCSESARPHAMRTIAVSHASAYRACHCSESPNHMPCVPFPPLVRSIKAHVKCTSSSSSLRQS